jgi:hypothetical protein
MIKRIVLLSIIAALTAHCTSVEPTATPAPGTETAPPVDATATEPPTAAPPAVTDTPSAPSGPVQLLAPAQNEAGAQFGTSVAMDGETAIIGAPRAEGGRGAVYVFVLEGGRWREVTRLTAGDGLANDFFGHSVAISGETIVVGARGHDALGFETGAAYIFQNQQGSWVQTQKLTSSTAQDIRFGWSVATDGETIVVGAPYRSVEAEIINVGSAIVFVNDGQGWVEQVRLTGESGGARSSDQFGWSVAVQESTIAVSAHLVNTVYLYSLSGGQWQEETALRGPESAGQFGYSLSLSNDTLAVGAPSTSTSETRGGVVSLFVRQGGGWIETVRVSPDEIGVGARFGWSVALQGDLLAVGARESGGTADIEQSGEVYTFRINGGSSAPVGQFAALNPAAFDHFGTAVAVSGSLILVGAPGQDTTPGAAYVIEQP